MLVDTLLAKVIGTANDRELKRIRPLIAEINSKEADTQRLSDEAAAREDGRIPHRVSPTASRSKSCSRKPLPSCARPGAAR